MTDVCEEGDALVGKMAYLMDFTSSSDLSCPCPACDYGKGATGKIIGQDKEEYKCPKCEGKKIYIVQLGKWFLLGKCYVTAYRRETKLDESTGEVNTEEFYTVEQKTSHVPMQGSPSEQDLLALEKYGPKDYNNFSHSEVDINDDVAEDRIHLTLDSALECIERSNKDLVEEAWEGLHVGQQMDLSDAAPADRSGAESYTRDRDVGMDDVTRDFLRDRHVVEAVDDL